MLTGFPKRWNRHFE